MEILGRFTGQTQGLMKNRDLGWTTPLCLAAYYGDYEFLAKMVELCDPLDLEARGGEPVCYDHYLCYSPYSHR